MARKKNWVECNSLKDLTKAKPIDLDISWSSSSSDSEDALFYKYKKKIRRDNSANDFEVKCEVSKFRNCSQSLSPVIGQNQLELSPTLNKISSDYNGESPVIGSNNIKIRLWKERTDNKELLHSESFSAKFELLNTNNNDYDISVYSPSSESQRDRVQLLSQFSENSSCENLKTQLDKRIIDIDVIDSVSGKSNDIFSHASGCINIDSRSPSKSEDECSFTISQFSTSQESAYCFASHRLSQSNNDTVTHFSSGSSQIPTSSEPVLYYHKVPKKKKIKKGGFMSQLQKALRTKSCIISMWEHELYLGQIDFCPDILHLRVLNIHVEFSSRICRCCFINPETNGENNKNCFLILDASVHHGVQCLQELKVYKPYSISNINYCNENVCCYYNVFKILFNS